ncbi:hypothetical protein LEP1GSC126_3354 [Leptospira kirschneri str. 200801774]|uniref:hypothetical protein n=1 Tax=Leptospira kirschneri TaxID=29507 RepID=UPI0002BD3608|nr:hypothetical protein [Leptospira kirschneri]EMO80194.1 hypothetical protein LEP1GSC126_3354 [Leptospira kirschneri str. 200801774]
MPNRQFDLSKLTVIIIRNGVPRDVTDGLSLEGDFFNLEPETKEETTTRKGLRGESYSVNINEGIGNSRSLTLKYLPSSPHVPYLHNLRESRDTFEFHLTNDSSPAMKFIGNECVIVEEPKTSINGKSGFADYDYKLRAPDGTLTFL